jgi:hypothetical protein
MCCLRGNFVGVEMNDEFSSMSHQMVLRPQMKLIWPLILHSDWLPAFPPISGRTA